MITLYVIIRRHTSFLGVCDTCFVDKLLCSMLPRMEVEVGPNIPFNSGLSTFLTCCLMCCVLHLLRCFALQMQDVVDPGIYVIWLLLFYSYLLYVKTCVNILTLSVG
jgi:hypothetical protein